MSAATWNDAKGMLTLQMGPYQQHLASVNMNEEDGVFWGLAPEGAGDAHRLVEVGPAGVSTYPETVEQLEMGCASEGNYLYCVTATEIVFIRMEDRTRFYVARADLEGSLGPLEDMMAHGEKLLLQHRCGAVALSVNKNDTVYRQNMDSGKLELARKMNKFDAFDEKDFGDLLSLGVSSAMASRASYVMEPTPRTPEKKKRAAPRKVPNAPQRKRRCLPRVESSSSSSSSDNNDGWGYREFDFSESDEENE